MQVQNKIERTHHNGACAACKHQRKKCSVNCLLAPYFPATRNREFEAVHKVFGVSNMSKLVKYVKDEERRRMVVESLIWEALCWQDDPILGSYGCYQKLYNQYIMLLQQFHQNNNNNIIMSKDYNQNHHHQKLQLPLLSHQHHQEDSKSFQNHHLGMIKNGQRSSVQDGVEFIQKHTKINNMTMDSAALYGLDCQQIESFNLQFQPQHPSYYCSGNNYDLLTLY